MKILTLTLCLLMFSAGCGDGEAIHGEAIRGVIFEPVVESDRIGSLTFYQEEGDQENLKIIRRIELIATDTWSGDYQPYKIILTHENGTSECIYGCFREKKED